MKLPSGWQGKQFSYFWGTLSWGKVRKKKEWVRELTYVSAICNNDSSLWPALQIFRKFYPTHEGFPGGLVVKNLPANAGDAGDIDSIPGPGRSPGGGNSNPLQYSCLKNPRDRAVWRTTVQGVAKRWTQLSDWTHTPNSGNTWNK